jgi:hypothetical protein
MYPVRVRISGSLFVICECKFAFCELSILRMTFCKNLQFVNLIFTITPNVFYYNVRYGVFCRLLLKFCTKGCVKCRIWLQFHQKIYKIRYETTAILFFASNVSTFQNWNFLQIFKKEICESIFPVLRRISSPRTKVLAARCECMHEHFHPITMLNS